MEQGETQGHKSNKWLLAIGFLIIGWFVYVNWWVPRQECASQVYFVPAKETIETGGVFGTKQGEAEHYKYSYKKFKTKQEAISYCTSVS